ncbi:hypothetical protein L1987_28440 [Smallanthus sonchifolius]|uniref:Uncharacterized protein n=1 Tax=Smallanthus sonchifolius TaxID=185202 RepID=A0ACB9HYN5_9ASTR|nr:hypothetical protein L1987_28440 [Smallanthus sonchifolius]
MSNLSSQRCSYSSRPAQTIDGKTIPLKILYNLSIIELKYFIEGEAGIPEEQQRLVYAGEELNDTRFLQSYYIENESILRLVDDAFMTTRVWMMIHVQIVATQKTIHLNVESTDTIHAVKAQEDIPSGKQVLFYPQKRLEEDSFTLADYFIQNESTLHLAQIHS